MKAYLYFTWEDIQDQEGYAMLKEAILHDVSEHIHPLGSRGFIFLTDKKYEELSKAIWEKQGRGFMLIDITDGLSTKKFNTSVDVQALRDVLSTRNGESRLDMILNKVMNKGGYSSLTQEERDYLETNSTHNEAKSC